MCFVRCKSHVHNYICVVVWLFIIILAALTLSEDFVFVTTSQEWPVSFGLEKSVGKEP